MTADSSLAEVSLSAWEFAGYVSFLFVIICCLAEFLHVIEAWHKPGSWWTERGGAAAALLLVVALAAELITQVMTNVISATLIAQQNRAAGITEERLLGERRLTSLERTRLRRLESIVLPRRISDFAGLVTVLKQSGMQPINLAIVQDREAEEFGLNFEVVLSQAGMLHGAPINLPTDSQAPSEIVMRINPEGDVLADLLFQRFRIGNGWRSNVPLGSDALKTDPSFKGIPTDRNCLVIGSNRDAAYQAAPGQDGEGNDQYGGAVPPP